MKKRNRRTAALLAAVLTLALCACGPAQTADPSPSPAQSGEPSASPAPERLGLSVCLGDEPVTVDPTLLHRRADASIVSHLFEGLMRWAPSGESDDGLGEVELVCGQAKDYLRTENADGTVTYTFHLREDAKWSDGKAVTAHDFVYAWQRLADPANAAYYADLIDCVVNAAAVESGEKEPSELAAWAVDDATFAVITQDVPWFLQLCAFPVTFPVRQDMVEQDPSQWTYSLDTFVTNGMYRLSTWSHGVGMALAPSEHYYDKAATQAAQPLTFTFLEGDEAILAAYQAKELDFAACAPAGQVPELMDKDEMDAADYVGVYYLTFQTQKAPFDDPRVRQAFTLAVDRKRLTEKTTAAGETPAYGYVPSGISDGDGGDFRDEGGDFYGDDYAANCRKARELLAQAGYPEGAGFPETVYLYNTGSHHKAVAEALREMWKTELGVEVTLKDQEWALFLQTRRDGDYSIARGSWTADFDDPASFLELWRTDAAGNDARYANAEYDQRIDAAATEQDGEKRMELLHQAEHLLVGRDFALCPLYFNTKPYLMADDVEGVCYSPLGAFFFHAAARTKG